MKKLFSASTLLISLFLTVNSNALEGKYYLKGDVGISFPATKMKQQSGYRANKRAHISPQYSVGAGYNATPQLRVDATYSQILNIKYHGKSTTSVGQESIQHQRTKADLFMLNGYYHFLEKENFSPLFSPFIGAGIGVAKIKHDTSSITFSNTSALTLLRDMKPATNLAFNMIAGISTPFTESLSVEWSYKYVYMGSNKGFYRERDFVGNTQTGVFSLSTKKFKLSAHNASIGIRYSF